MPGIVGGAQPGIVGGAQSGIVGGAQSGIVGGAQSGIVGGAQQAASVHSCASARFNQKIALRPLRPLREIDNFSQETANVRYNVRHGRKEHCVC